MSSEGHSRLDTVVETARLLLRVPRIGDFDGYADLVGDEEAARHIGGHMVREAAWRKFLQQPGAWLVQGFGMFSVIDKASGEWLGQAGPWKPEGWPGNEIGWAFRRAAWGRGFATEAAAAAMDWAFGHLGWDDVIHCIAPANVASQLVAQRLGSAALGEARMPPPYEDVSTVVWGQTRAQWRQNRERLLQSR
ncbi:GNAT family N-acetyltransferase [Pseudofulvimonas gallinarii]|uniref:RimJ/RimL family protein N-acetyltransferase n=1 Tax=Pseudofulvimonas gallinarii TaxID=634155 RepID=A0A4R3LIS3_9GAMM|nr:GNAT family N-acetyltransferase [Pseudofulvimonas gallinarii]TCT00053.1 RimJ/RimL family protein N-acetyltransferase [Pseudofulvimonas gallinarii]